MIPTVHTHTVTNRQYCLNKLGLSSYAWSELKKIATRLHKIDEDCCNGYVQHDEVTNRWHRYREDRYGSPTIIGSELRYTPDTLLARAQEVVSRYNLKAYHQSDPRGCSLYLYKPEDLAACSRGSEPGYGIHAYYNQIGTAIC